MHGFVLVPEVQSYLRELFFDERLSGAGIYRRGVAACGRTLRIAGDCGEKVSENREGLRPRVARIECSMGNAPKCELRARRASSGVRRRALDKYWGEVEYFGG